MFCFSLCTEGARINTYNIWGLLSVCCGLRLLPGLRGSLQCLHYIDESQIVKERRLLFSLAYLALARILDSKKLRKLCCLNLNASKVYYCLFDTRET